jgi:Na+/proline symporter
VAITPALVAALVWRRATAAGGIASIVVGALTAVVLDIVIPAVAPAIVVDGDPFGIPGIYPAFLASILALVLVSLVTKPPAPETLEKIFGPAPAP